MCVYVDMQLTRGARLGVYEVIAPIATGGMGEVYRARDTTLGREVALKLLTHDARIDPDRQARFEREARAIAALSHPNILTIYSFGTEGGIAYAAMEWLEGHTLREEISQGPLPVRRAIHYASQIALGLAAAHAKGIVHRDLKPENVFIAGDGRVKLLDFGLARIASDRTSIFPAGATQADHETGAGMLLGSLGYMSPEQLSGAVADARSDVFSLGIVMFEMLTGRLPFWRETAADTFTATLKEEPPAITALRPDVPTPLERIVIRCLEKSPAERFQSAQDLAFALLAFALPSGPANMASASLRTVFHRARLVAGAAAVVTVIAGAIAWSYWPRAAQSVRPLVTFAISRPAGVSFADVPSKMLAISPDGEHVVFAVERAGRRELWIRHLNAVDAVPLPGTENATEPFWSPDGQHIGFFADSRLKRVAVDGTKPLVLCDAPPEARGATWNQAGIILFSDGNGGLSRVADTGGVPSTVTAPDRANGDDADSWPQFLPDGRRFLYLRQRGRGLELGGTAVLRTLDGSGEHQLLTGVFNASFIPPDLLLFADADAIKIQRIDLDRGVMTGDIEEFSLEVDRHLGRAALAVSQNGTLAYASAGSGDHRLIWMDRKGDQVGDAAPPDGWRDVAISPDGSHVAVQRIASGANDIWTIDVARGVPSRFTFSADVDDDPVWSPDGARIAFSSVRDGVPGIYQQALDGVTDAELLFTNQAPVHPTSWSPDDQSLLFDATDPRTASDVWVLQTHGDRTARPYLATVFAESDAHFSPDGKWVAYTSDESGRSEVYVQSFPEPHGKIQVSIGGGTSPRWAAGRAELYFLSADLWLMAVRIRRLNPLDLGAPLALFETSVGLGSNRYAPARDGQRFLLSLPTEAGGAAPLVVVLNWAGHLATTRRTQSD